MAPYRIVCSFQNIRNLSDYHIEAKLISATLLRVGEIAEEISVEWKFRDIFCED